MRWAVVSAAKRSTRQVITFWVGFAIDAGLEMSAAG